MEMFLTVYRIALLLRRLAEKLKDRMINMSLHLAVSDDASLWHLVLFQFFRICKITSQVIYYMDDADIDIIKSNIQISWAFDSANETLCNANTWNLSYTYHEFYSFSTLPFLSVVYRSWYQDFVNVLVFIPN